MKKKLDTEPKTGDLPGADFDHTISDGRNRNDHADVDTDAILAQTVEQRFRKPIDSQELPQASEQPPGNAREVDQALKHVESARRSYRLWEPVEVLYAEVRRLRALFGGFQLECCDDWSCAQDHARRAGEELARLRKEIAKLLEDNAEIRAYNSRLAEQCAESLRELDRLRDENERWAEKWRATNEAYVNRAGELIRFRDREPLVQQMVNAIMDDPQQLDADEPACAIVRFGDPATPDPSAEAADESS